MAEDIDETYVGGLGWLRLMREHRVVPFVRFWDAMPPDDVDFGPLKRDLVPPVPRPLALHLMEALNKDDRNAFRRLDLIRRIKQKQTKRQAEDPE